MKVYLVFAGAWTVLAVMLFFLWPSPEQNATIGLNQDTRIWLAGFATVLVGFNIVRWRLWRVRRRDEDELRDLRTRHTSRRHDEPPNPDFDFSDPKPGGPKA